MAQIPTFLIMGFLDSGKTSFIENTIETDGFGSRGKTLLIICEEGEVELDPDFLRDNQVEFFNVASEEEFNSSLLDKAIKKAKPNRIVIELNGMWNINELKFPGICRIAQVLTFIDFTTFTIYFNNMRQKMIDMIKLSQVVVFNRVEDIDALAPYQVNMKMTNGQAQYLIMDDDYNAEQAFEDPLPYDVEADVINIEDKDFGRFYIDTFDNPERYQNKVVKFKAMVVLSNKLPKGNFIAGRRVMTCCSNDVQLYGHLCNSMLDKKLKDKAWIILEARVTFEYSKEYKEDELVLNPISIEIVDALSNPVIDLR